MQLRTFLAQAPQNSLAQLVAHAVLLGEFGHLKIEREAQREFAEAGIERGGWRRLRQQAGNIGGACGGDRASPSRKEDLPEFRLRVSHAAWP